VHSALASGGLAAASRLADRRHWTAMFHGIGPNGRYRQSQLRFEVDGAHAARVAST
jgi:hypothetical protein